MSIQPRESFRLRDSQHRSNQTLDRTQAITYEQLATMPELRRYSSEHIQ